MSVSFSTHKGVDTNTTIPVRDDLAGYTNLKIELSSNSRFGGIPATTTVVPVGGRTVRVALSKAFTDVFKDGYFRIVGTKGGVFRVLQTGVVDFAEEGPKPGLSATAEASILELIGAGGGGGGSSPSVYNRSVYTFDEDLSSDDPPLVISHNWPRPMPTDDYEVKYEWPLVKTMERYQIVVPPLADGAGMSPEPKITWKFNQWTLDYKVNVLWQGEPFPGTFNQDYTTYGETNFFVHNNTGAATTKSYYAEIWTDYIATSSGISNGVLVIDNSTVVDNNTVDLTVRVLPPFGSGPAFVIKAGTNVIFTAMSPGYTP